MPAFQHCFSSLHGEQAIACAPAAGPGGDAVEAVQTIDDEILPEAGESRTIIKEHEQHDKYRLLRPSRHDKAVGIDDKIDLHFTVSNSTDFATGQRAKRAIFTPSILPPHKRAKITECRPNAVPTDVPSDNDDHLFPEFDDMFNDCRDFSVMPAEHTETAGTLGLNQTLSILASLLRVLITLKVLANLLIV